MQFKIFTIPADDDDGTFIEEVNKFLRSHKVLEVEQQLSRGKTGDNWRFCVKYLANSPSAETAKPQGISRIDYRETLDEATFARFSLLREGRKKIAEEEGMPVFAIFTNEELAGIAALDEMTVSNLTQIKGIGDKKAERFGKRLVEYYSSIRT
jgi:superfamily II DNA helicase RecQ